MGLLIAATSTALHNYYKPFNKPDDNLDQAIVLSVISFSLFSGLLLKTDTASDDEYEISAFAAVLTAVNVVAIVVPPVHLVAALYQKKRKKKPVQIAPEEHEENLKETQHEDDTNISDGDGKGEAKVPEPQLAAKPGLDEGAITPSSTMVAMLPQPQRIVAPPTILRDNFAFSQSGQHSIVQPAPAAVPIVQPAATPRTVVPTDPLLTPPAQTTPAAVLMTPILLQSEQPASRCAYSSSGENEPQAVLPAPWRCSRCTYEHGFECCAAKASCCMCGAARAEA